MNRRIISIIFIVDAFLLLVWGILKYESHGHDNESSPSIASEKTNANTEAKHYVNQEITYGEQRNEKGTLMEWDIPEEQPTVAKTAYSETKAVEKRASTPYGTYTFSENGYEYKVILKADETAQLIPEKGAKIRPVEGDVAYGSWDESSSYGYGIDAEFKVKEIITDPFRVGKWDVQIYYYHCYFKEGYVYHSWKDAKAKDPTSRVPYTKTN